MCPLNTLRHLVTLLISCAVWECLCGTGQPGGSSPSASGHPQVTPESTGVLTERLTFQTAVLKVSRPRRDCLTQHRGDKCLTQQTHPWNCERLTSGSVRYVREMWKELDTKQTVNVECWEGRVRRRGGQVGPGGASGWTYHLESFF